MLREAARIGKPKLVEMLLESGASTFETDAKGNTALMCASGKNHLAVVRQLLTAGADPALRTKDGKTAADYAECGGNAAIVKLLSPTASHMVLPKETFKAVGCGDMAALEAWLSGGGHVDAQEENGVTMLTAASITGNEAMVATLLQRGASVNLQSTTGSTALMWASYHNHPAVLRQLLAAGWLW